MKRRDFIKNSVSISAMSTLGSLQKLSENLSYQDYIMPALFIGHGSPMNAIENNEFSDGWRKIAKNITVPTAVLCVSAHWLTRGTFVTMASTPKTIHDFGGFPKALFDVQYPAAGSPSLAQETMNLIKNTSVIADHDWGFDHGSWSVVKQMYPNADIPMIQLSIDFYKPGTHHFEIGQFLTDLRKKGVLIIGSGNMIHNLRMISLPANADPLKGFNVEYGFDWALDINSLLKKKITEGDFLSLANYTDLHKDIKLAVPTPDHYFPLLYILGLKTKTDNISFFNDKVIAGSLNMTSLLIS